MTWYLIKYHFPFSVLLSYMGGSDELQYDSKTAISLATWHTVLSKDEKVSTMYAWTYHFVVVPSYQHIRGTTGQERWP
jgi:hypothetical protein